MPLDVSRIEIERINNMIINFDWSLTKQEILEDKIILTIEKLLPVVIPKGTEGAE
jgi:hypothetical protein